MSEETLILKTKVFFSEEIGGNPIEYLATVVSSQNKVGRFDVLPQHINFITLIFDDITIRTSDEEEIKYQFKKGVLEVDKNTVNVFLGV